MSLDDIDEVAKTFPAMPDTARLFFVEDILYSVGGGNVFGIAFNSVYSPPPPDDEPSIYANRRTPQTTIGTGFVRLGRDPYTAAHEMGHVLMDKSLAKSEGHYAQPADVSKAGERTRGDSRPHVPHRVPAHGGPVPDQAHLGPARRRRLRPALEPLAVALSPVTVRSAVALLVAAAMSCRDPPAPTPMDAGGPSAIASGKERARTPAERIRGRWMILPAATRAWLRDFDDRIRDAGTEEERNVLRGQQNLEAILGSYRLEIRRYTFVVRDSRDHVIAASTYRVAREEEQVVTIEVDGDGSYTFFLDEGDTMHSPEIGRKYGDERLQHIHVE